MKLYASPVTFTPSPHSYHLGDMQLEGVTSGILSWLFPSTYDGIPQEVLDRAAERGSSIHDMIQAYDEADIKPDHSILPTEVAEFLRLRETLGLKPEASEYIVSDEKRMASKIDNVSSIGRTAYLSDTKCTSEVHTPNVTAQLSIYRLLFHLQNPKLKVADVGYCFWLPREQYGKPKVLPLNLLDYDTTQLVIDAYYNNYDAEPYRALFRTNVELPAEYTSMVQAIVEIEQTAKAMADRKKQLSDALLSYFRQNNIQKFSSDLVDITYVAPTTRESVDSKRLKADHPDIYTEYKKVSEVSDSIRIKTKTA